MDDDDDDDGDDDELTCVKWNETEGDLSQEAGKMVPESR